MRRVVFVALAVVMTAAFSPATGDGPVVLGAVYPAGGSHGRGGVDEFRGVQLAAEYVNARGGVGGRPVSLRLVAAESADQAARAVNALAGEGVQAILGSYGSTISRPAADAAQRAGVVFWETGAVGELGMTAAEGDLVFRFPPTGGTLGRTAVSFARDTLLPRLGRDLGRLRAGVTYVDDDYGRSVGLGAIDELRDAGVRIAGVYPYDLATFDARALVRRMRADRIRVLFVSAYLDDAVAMRKQMVRLGLPLVASVGTSSSYCMHEFGEALGDDAVGLFASDKPDGHVLDPARLDADAAAALRWARDAFADRFDHGMTAPALTGFAGAYALMRHVLPAAPRLDATAIADAARTVSVPVGGLPNGSGMDFEAGSTDNLRATSVIWQWSAPGVREVVWPAAFATAPLRAIELS